MSEPAAEPLEPNSPAGAADGLDAADATRESRRIGTLRLNYSAISDVGRVRKDNQDSGYAGPWLLTICDGVGGAARGDIASATAVQQLRELDHPPRTSDLLEELNRQIDRAHIQIAELVDEDPALNGTSTTATVVLFDGSRAAIGHVGDSRGYLYRDGELSQLTTDHTFVQSLVDEGRITEEESRVHPQRNLILKALDGVQETEPDLFMIELVAGDRLFLCSDGASGSLNDARLADILSTGTPDYAAVELVRASLEAGSTDNVTCIVADVVTEEQAAEDPAIADLEPLLVGAAAELRRNRRGVTGLFRGHRSGDTGELEPVDAEIPDDLPRAIRTDPVDPEQARYAPQAPRRFRWLSRLLIAACVIGLLWIAVAIAWSWSQSQYYVGEQDGRVVIFRGVDADLPGIDLSKAYETSDVEVDRLPDYHANRVRDSIQVDDLDAAEAAVDELYGLQDTEDASTDGTDGTDDTDGTSEPSPTQSPDQSGSTDEQQSDLGGAVQDGSVATGTDGAQ